MHDTAKAYYAHLESLGTVTAPCAEWLGNGYAEPKELLLYFNGSLEVAKRVALLPRTTVELWVGPHAKSEWVARVNLYNFEARGKVETLLDLWRLASA